MSAEDAENLTPRAAPAMRKRKHEPDAEEGGRPGRSSQGAFRPVSEPNSASGLDVIPFMKRARIKVDLEAAQQTARLTANGPTGGAGASGMARAVRSAQAKRTTRPATPAKKLGNHSLKKSK